MATRQPLQSVDWVLQAFQSQNTSFHNISFYHDQPNSSCYQETENSININISTDESSLSAFSQLLTALAASKVSQTSLKILEFHRVSWETHQVRTLGAVMDKHSNIKQVTFQRNKFSEQGLSELSELLGRNTVIRELIFSESGIGYHGASLLASALKRNETLEELQIWEDSVGSKGAEELSKMIEVNSTIKLLIILDTSSITATPLISAVLARNRFMEVHVWSGDNRESSSKVVEFVPENTALRIYKLDASGSCRVTCALGWNSTVRLLDLTGVKLKSRWAREFRIVLEQNHTLKQVKLSRTCLKDKGVIYVAAGLFKNQGLECLEIDGNWFSGVGIEHLLCPLSRFSALQSQANMTLRSLTFGGGKTKIRRDGMLAILKLLETNQSLTYLGIHDDETLKSGDFISIFRSLERNATLKCISLMGSKGVTGEKLLETIMDTLQVNPWIEEIELEKTPLQAEGKSERIYLKLGQNGGAESEMDLLKDMPVTAPRSCRVFLCGQEFAGKTTICDSISQNFSSFKLPYLDHIRTLVNPVEQAVRTEGMKIKTIQEEGIKISIWNLAGQHEFFALHDLMFPGHGSPSFFFIVTSLFRKPDNKQPKSPDEVEEDLLYWLRFVVSNSKRAKMQYMLPNITVILTHIDKVANISESLKPTLSSIQKLRERFLGFVEFYPRIFTVDSRSSGSVSILAHHVRKTSKTIVERVPPVYQLCNDLIQILSDWRTDNHNKTAIRWKEFCDLCQVRIPALKVRSRHDNLQKVEMRRRAVASALHQVGEIIYFEDLDFLILDCDWFCGDVLGELIKLKNKKYDSTENSGFISRKELERLLKKSLQSKVLPGMGQRIHDNLAEGDLIKMMLKLELCYEQESGNPNSIMLIPIILEEGRVKTQKWPLNAANFVHVGRHLECHDSSHMFLTPGFFPRLQVHLYNKLMGSKNQHGATYYLEKYLISITIHGIFVRVELGGQLGHHIDVLACSTQSIAEMLRLYQQLILPTIQGLCHGITLAESIIRPECVKYLTSPRYRRTQYVSLQRLKEALLTVSADSMYDYQHTWSPVVDGSRHILPSGFNLARDLLSDDDFREVLHRRYNDLYNLAVELEIPLDDNPEPQTQNESNGNVEPTLAGIAKGVEAVLQRLKIIEMDIKDLKQEIQGLRYYEHRLLIELHRKVNYLVNYSVQVQERKVPNMFYFVQTENYTRRLVTNMISGMMALRLNMLCEFRREMHVVEGQLGCELMKVDNRTVQCLVPYMNKFMKLLTFALKIGAQLAAGMGHLIPDLSREVAQLAHSSLGYGAAAVGAGAIGATLIGRRSAEKSRDGQQDFKGAHQWLVDFLRSQNCTGGKEIAEKFGLWRVRYRDDGQVAWICRRHLEVRAYEIIEFPV